MYVKVKRRRLTLFVRVQPSDSVNTVRDSVYSTLFSQGGDASVTCREDVALMTVEHAMLDGAKSLVDNKIENGSVLCLVRKKTDGTFEDPCVIDTSSAQNDDDNDDTEQHDDSH